MRVPVWRTLTRLRANVALKLSGDGRTEVMDLLSIQTRWQLGLLRSGEVPGRAAALLSECNAGGALGALAMLGPSATADEVRPLLQSALKEAHCRPVTDDEARWRVAYETAQQIVTGEVTPLEGATVLWSIATDLGLPEPLRYFAYLAADYGEGPNDPDAERAWFDERIVETARELLATPRAIQVPNPESTR